MAARTGSTDHAELTKRWAVNFRRYLYDCDTKGVSKMANEEMHVAMLFDGVRSMLIASFEEMVKGKATNEQSMMVFDHAKKTSLAALQLLCDHAPKQSLERAYEIGLVRNHDYGQQNITSFGVPGLVVRIGDKAIRIVHLLSIQEKPASNERIEDTLIDIVNYATFGRMLIDGVWL